MFRRRAGESGDRFRRVMPRTMLSLILAGAAIAVSDLALAQTAERPAPDTFEATTSAMSPERVTLRVVVREWSDAAARIGVAEVLSESADATTALAELPSVGVVWRSGSGVGHALKYAYREQTASGQERLTFVTEKPIDSYSFKPWEVPGRDAEPLGYTVIELLLDESGSGTGTLSLAAEVGVDTGSGAISLVTEADTPAVLAGARELPPPYWAQSGNGQ